MSGSEILNGLFAKEGNFLTIIGNSELGIFLNEALSQSVQSFQHGSNQSSSVTNLQISLQSPNYSLLNQSSRSCSKINPDLFEEGDVVKQNKVKKTGQKWKSCAAGLNRIPPTSPRHLGPSIPSPYIPFSQSNLSERKEERTNLSNACPLSFNESISSLTQPVGQSSSQKSQSQNEISASPLLSRPLMSSSCDNVSKLQKEDNETENSFFCGSNSTTAKAPSWRRTSVSTWIQAWEKLKNDEKEISAYSKTDSVDPFKHVSDSPSKVLQISEDVGLPSILTSSLCSTSCSVQAFPRNSIEDTIDSQYVDRLQVMLTCY